MLSFTDQNHKYSSIDPQDKTDWLSVTTVISALHEKFLPEVQAPKSSVRKSTARYPNKWFSVPVDEIVAAWKAEGDRSTELGTYYHNMREQQLYDTQEKVIKPIVKNGIKIASNQQLEEGIYPEHLVYLQSAGICGQSDYVEVKNGHIIIKDYKTSKEINRKGFTNWEGTKMMLPPVAHLQDCHLSHYSLQLSIYMFCILRHNSHLLPGEMTIEHVKFEVESEDRWGYPVYLKDADGNFVVKEIELIPIPYLKSEVVSILNWLKTNKSKLLKH